jgi:hypothetical protein
MKRLFSLIVFLATVSIAWSSPDSLLKKLLRYDSLYCISLGDTLRYPWSGAFNTPQFSNIDLNGDFINDLFVFDRDGGEVRIFLHTGDSGEASYIHAPEYEASFPRLHSWALLKDFNRDQKPDIFTGRKGGDISVFINVSTGSKPEDIAFEPYLFRDANDTTKRTNWLTYKYFVGGGMVFTNVYCLNSDIPGLADIDGDGDMDILSFGNGTGSIVYYKNISYETYGHFDSLDYRISYQCWGGFREDATNFKLHLNQCVGQAPLIHPHQNQRGASRHEGSTTLAYDFDCNNRVDLALGDISFDYAVVGYNRGIAQLDEITEQDTSFPRYDVPVNVQRFPAMFIADVNNDFIDDFIAAPNDESFYANFNQIHYYRGEKDGSCTKFRYQQNDLLQHQTLEFGSHAHPSFFDVDGDSLIDILVGNYGYLSGGFKHNAGIAYLKNVGISTNPAYELITRDLIPLHNAGDTGLYPSFGDLDGDSIYDMLLGTASGRLYFYKNMAANRGDSAVFVYQPMHFDSIVFATSIQPTLYDLNKDGRLDIIAGWQAPDLLYIPNSGSATQPDFKYNDMANNLGGVFHSNDIGEGYLSPLIVEQDSNGMVRGLDTLPNKTYLYVGTMEGSIYLYENISTTTTFNPLDNLFLYGRNLSLTGADITGDGKMDMAYGHRTGGLSILLKDKGNIIRQPPVKPKDTTAIQEFPNLFDGQLRVFPNPAVETIELLWSGPAPSGSVSYNVINLDGQIVMSFKTEHRHFQANISALVSGMYVIQAHSETHRAISRFVKR